MFVCVLPIFSLFVSIFIYFFTPPRGRVRKYMRSTHGTMNSEDLKCTSGVCLPMRTQIWVKMSTPEGQNRPDYPSDL